MNAGLVYLLRKGPRSAWRRLARRFRGPKGILLLIGSLLIFALIVGPQILAYVQIRRMGHSPDLDAGLRRFVPPVTLVLTLMSLSKGALYFKPSEIQFLFPAPISRRQLLLYNVVSRLRVQVLSALWMSLFFVSRAPLWYAVPPAVFLLLAFLQLSAQASGLLLATLDERLAKNVRRFGVIVVLGAAVAGIAVLKAKLGSVELATLADTPIVRAVSWITRPFLETYLARTPGELLAWGAVSLAIVGLVLAALMLFDVAYTEDALAQAKRLQQALKRMSSGGAFAASGPKKNRLRIPVFPRMSGAGPIARRHCQEMARNVGGVLRIGLMMAIWIAMAILMPGHRRHDQPEGPESLFGPLLLVLIMTPLLSTHLAFDFRRDLDRMPLLKSLPISGAALTCGQILPTALLFTAWEVLGVLVIAVASGKLPADLVAALILTIPALNWIITAIDNLIFLLMPYRPPTRDPGRFPFMGRMMVVMFLKMIALAVLFGLGALAAYLTWSSLARSALLCGAVVTVLLASVAWPLTHAVASAFRAFDVSRDLPE